VQSIGAVSFAVAITGPHLKAADHGPVSGLATPTNPKGEWNFDQTVNGRGGSCGATAIPEALLSYGLTPNIQLSVSGPVVIAPDKDARSSVTANTPISGDLSALMWWRFQKKDFAGKRVESTAVAGVLAPAPQAEAGLYRGLNSGPGSLVGATTGIASRSQYVWVGSTYQRYAESREDRRPDLILSSFVYGYRPQSWCTDDPRWDWRVFAELTGERSGSLRRNNATLPGSEAAQTLSLVHCVARRTAEPRGVAEGRLVDLRHGLNDLRPRRERGIERSSGSGIGRRDCLGR